MFVMRSSPQGGIHCTVGRAARACSRSVPAAPPRGAWSSAMNHCSVARNSVGFLHRQQWGYVCVSEHLRDQRAALLGGAR
jgi:hypothetical protein